MSSLIPKVNYFNLITLFYRETFDCDRTIISKRKKIFSPKRIEKNVIRCGLKSAKTEMLLFQII